MTRIAVPGNTEATSAAAGLIGEPLDSQHHRVGAHSLPGRQADHGLGHTTGEAGQKQGQTPQ